MGLGVGGIVSIGGGTGSGSGSTSGIQSINGQIGPDVFIVGVSGVEVVTQSNTIYVSISGVATHKYAESFTNIVSGLFTHNLNTLDVIVQVKSAPTGGGRVILPDLIVVENKDQVSIVYNRSQSGRIIIIG